jgi:hypothetical protein
VLLIQVVSLDVDDPEFKLIEINTGRKSDYVGCYKDPRVESGVLLVERKSQGGRLCLSFSSINIHEPDLIVYSSIKDFVP